MSCCVISFHAQKKAMTQIRSLGLRSIFVSRLDFSNKRTRLKMELREQLLWEVLNSQMGTRLSRYIASATFHLQSFTQFPVLQDSFSTWTA